MKEITRYTNFEIQEASKINSAIAELPVAREERIIVNQANTTAFKAIVVGETVIDIPTKSYCLVQHSEAFRPVIEGLTQAGISDFKFATYSTDKVAHLNLFVGNINDGRSSIQVGIHMQNSFNRTSTVNYGFRLNEREAYIEIVGYRQVCSNGMKIRVPLENAEIIQAETVEKLKNLITHFYSFKHRNGVIEKIANMQYVAEAFSLLQEPLNAYVKQVQKIPIESIEKARLMIKKHFSERMQQKILSQYQTDIEVEGSGLWGLYNAITYVASHDSTVRQKEAMENVAASILNEQLVEVTR